MDTITDELFYEAIAGIELDETDIDEDDFDAPTRSHYHESPIGEPSVDFFEEEAFKTVGEKSNRWVDGFVLSHCHERDSFN